MTTTVRGGFSEAAKTLERVRFDQAVRRAETVTFSNHPLFDQLIDIYMECSNPGWDGDSSKPVEKETLSMAKQLIESLPLAYRTPTIDGEPDGHVSLEWYVHPRRLLTVSINPNGTLHWAALIGSEDPRGSCPFYGELPKTLMYWIGRICAG